MKFSRYIFGTTRLGHADVSDDRAREVARAAVAAGVWFHTSRQYDEVRAHQHDGVADEG